MTRLIALTALLAACGSNGLDDPRFATGSSTVVSARENNAVYAVNVDEGSISRVVDGKVTSLQVGAEPTRITRVGDQLWVTLRGERSVAVVNDIDGELTIDSIFDVGAEPTGIVASENGKRVFVAVSQNDTVLEFDGKTKTRLRTFAVMDDPRWLALHPSNKVLFVASPYSRELMWIDLVEGNVFRMETPAAERPTDRGDVELTGRFTGDPAISVDGEEVAFPMFYVDNESSVDTPDDGNIEVPSPDGYGSSGLGVSRMNPSLLVIETDPETGIPDVDVSESKLLFLAGFSNDFEFTEESKIVRSYPTSVAASPKADDWVVTFEGSAAVAIVSRASSGGNGGGPVAVDVATEPGRGSGGVNFSSVDPQDVGFAIHPVNFVNAGAGAIGVAFIDDDRAMVHSWMDRSVALMPYDAIRRVNNGNFGDAAMGDAIVLADSALDADVEAGRRMFFSATDNRMAGSGAGISCATCHFDGRNDGLTWTLNDQLRQTPSLAGPVQLTAPVTWSEGVDSVADEAMLTTSLRMGGGGLTEDEALKIEAYVNWSRLPDVELAGSRSELVRLGEEVFNRAEVGCATCHTGEQYTDNQSYKLYGSLATQTPTLRGISASAPYLHDGSVRTLRGLLEKVQDGSMGNTSSLTKHELDALEAYLKSL